MPRTSRIPRAASIAEAKKCVQLLGSLTDTIACVRFAAEISSPTGNLELSASTVLIVDDDVELVEALTEFLEHKGYAIATAADGSAALDQLRRGLRPCVILLDLTMPGMNGWDFRREQMKDDELEHIPVIVMTAAGLSARSVKAELGDVEFVPKPDPNNALVAAIRRRCGHPSVDGD